MCSYLCLATRLAGVLLCLGAAAAIAWDAFVLEQGQPDSTLSSALRNMNAASGGLLAWGLVGLWLHLFANVWK